jgi:hypothetical protein
MSVALHPTLSLELPIFVLVTLGDLELVLGLGKKIRDGWSQANLLPCLELTGIVAFQFAIYQMSNLWAKE